MTVRARTFLVRLGVCALLFLAGCSQLVVHGRATVASVLSSAPARFTREEQTARDYVSRTMTIDYHDLDDFAKNLTTKISGDLQKTTTPDQVATLKQLFAELQVVSTFEVLASSVLEERPDHAVITVAGRQTLTLKGDQGPRSSNVILKVTVQKADQTVSGLESLGQDGKSSGGGPFPGMPR